MKMTTKKKQRIHRRKSNLIFMCAAACSYGCGSRRHIWLMCNNIAPFVELTDTAVIT